MVKLNMMVHRWRSALEIAKQLKGDDAERHRLYARASAAVGVAEKDKSAIDLARQEYEAAEAKEPGDVDSAEELARIYRDLQDNPARAPAGARPGGQEHRQRPQEGGRGAARPRPPLLDASGSSRRRRPTSTTPSATTPTG